MKFHNRTLERIRLPLGTSVPDEIAAAEQRLQITFPQAVREWYSDIDGRQILAQYGNDDRALAPADFELLEIGGLRLVRFLVENQGVCWWGFEFNGSNDPPIHVNLDPPSDDLFVYLASFSEFTYVRVFDHENFWDPKLCSMSICDPMTDDDMAALEKMLTVEPKSFGWPSTDVHRFSSSFGRITIWSGKEQSDWIISGHSPEDRDRLTEQVALFRRGVVE